MRVLYALLLFALLTSCGRDHDLDRDSTSGGDTYSDQESLARAEKAAANLLGTNGDRYRAAWDQRSTGPSWTNAVLVSYRERKDSFNQAVDLPDFCPGFASATPTQKETCWLRIISAMAYFESSFNPKATYKEHTGTLSVGLLMMNVDHCPKANTETALKDGVNNIHCALARMERLIKRDQAISGPPTARGAAAYWSVLRPPYLFRELHLGKKPHIQKFTKTYLAFDSK